MTDPEPMAHRLEDDLVRVGVDGRAREEEASAPIVPPGSKRAQSLLVPAPIQHEVELEGEVQEDADVGLRIVSRELDVELRLVHERGDEGGAPRE
eukprot:13422703-Alexandrium_andersonii.AAC.1